MCDPGSTTFLRHDEASDEASGFLYENPMADIREGLRIARTHRIRPGYAIYEPGFTRLGAAPRGAGAAPAGAVYRFMFSDEFAWGFPPRPGYLDAHLALLAECAPDRPGWWRASASTSCRWCRRPSPGRHVRSGWRTRRGDPRGATEPG